MYRVWGVPDVLFRAFGCYRDSVLGSLRFRVFGFWGSGVLGFCVEGVKGAKAASSSVTACSFRRS